MTETVFSASDANALVQIAQEAPIPGGARMAQARAELYQRFLKWYEGVTTPDVPAPKPRKPRAAVSQEKAAEDILG